MGWIAGCSGRAQFLGRFWLQLLGPLELTAARPMWGNQTRLSAFVPMPQVISIDGLIAMAFPAQSCHR